MDVCWKVLQAVTTEIALAIIVTIDYGRWLDTLVL
jgi:hypothetical protein